MHRVSWTAAQSEFPTALAWCGDELVVGLADGTLAFHNGASGNERRRSAAHGGGVLALAVHPHEPIVASAGEEGAVRLHRGAETIDVDPVGGGWVEHLAWSPAGKRLAASQGPVVRIWSLDGRLLARSPALASTVTGLAWSRDGHRVAAACYGGVSLIDATSSTVVQQLPWKGSMLGLTWSPDGRFLATGGQDSTVHFWRMPSGDDSMMSGYPSKPTALAWSADSKRLATGGAAQITVWPFDGKGPEGREPETLEGHDDLVTALAFAPRRRTLASGCRGGRLALWPDTDTAEPVAAFELGDRVEVLAWHPSATRIAGTTGGAVTVVVTEGRA